MLPNMPSFKGYDKLTEAEQARLETRRKTRKRIAIIALSSTILVVIILASVFGTLHNNDDKPDSGNSHPNSLQQSIKAICNATLYPDSCFKSLSPIAKSDQINPVDLFKLSLQVAMDELMKVADKLPTVPGNSSMDVLDNCQKLLGLAVDRVNGSLSSTGDLTSLDIVDDLKTFLSSAGTYLQTCLDGFQDTTVAEKSKNQMAQALRNSTEFTSNSLAILSRVTDVLYTLNSLNLRRRLLDYSGGDFGEFPAWLSSRDRKLLASSDPRASADAVVAKDGTGKYKTITAALSAVPEKSKKRFVIYVKKGVYYENVQVNKTKWNVMIVGDGMNATVVSGRRNFVDGTPTFSTATFAAFGKGFIAINMGFVNIAGAIKQQAVALMSDSDQSIFYRCRMDAFQDTLYAHSLRQFYRECDISGTVDFIFGNAAVVLQNCTIRAKKPIPGQQNTLTAQGKTDPNQNTGISIQNCVITPAENLYSVRTYLGRPWKPYSTTIFMQSMLGSLIDSAGWLPWTGNSAPDTIFYAEYQNYGPGSTTKNRVKWKGYKSSISEKQASKFTVKSFIKGGNWISTAGVSYSSGL